MTVPQFAETVIIGGGIAGLACARRLYDSSRPFVLITEDVGGRVRNSDSGTVNLGAYYVRGDYHHVNRFVDLGRSVKRMRILRHDHDRSYTRWDHRLFGHLPQAARFLWLLNEFRLHYEVFKQTCVEMSQARALAADPLLWNLYHEPARRFIQRHRIQDIAHWYIAPVVHGTAFTSVDRLTAFSLLALALPAVIPVYEFKFRFDLLLAGFEDDLVFDSVTRLMPAASGGYSIHTRGTGTFAAHHIVVATPVDVSARLINLAPLKNPVDVHTFLLRGSLRRPWSRADVNLFPDGEPTLTIARQADGSILFCSTSGDPDLARYFTTWEVVEHHYWTPAFHLEGDALLECEQRPGLFLVGDHNVCGLEDSYITGIHAADRILASSKAGAMNSLAPSNGRRGVSFITEGGTRPQP
jgi:hypothetical protein